MVYIVFCRKILYTFLALVIQGSGFNVSAIPKNFSGAPRFSIFTVFFRDLRIVSSFSFESAVAKISSTWLANRTPLLV
jgi:hypothetical protein